MQPQKEEEEEIVKPVVARESKATRDAVSQIDFRRRSSKLAVSEVVSQDINVTVFDADGLWTALSTTIKTLSEPKSLKRMLLANLWSFSAYFTKTQFVAIFL